MDIVKVTPAVSSSASAATPVKQQKSKRVRWQAYVDNALLRTGQVNQAAIFGLDGVQWASSKDFKVTPQQVAKLLVNITGETSSLRREGIVVGTQTYIFLRSEKGRSIYGRKGADTGVCVVKTKKAILIGTYGAGIQPGNCNTVMERLADYLIQYNL